MRVFASLRFLILSIVLVMVLLPGVLIARDSAGGLYPLEFKLCQNPEINPEIESEKRGLVCAWENIGKFTKTSPPLSSKLSRDPPIHR